MALRMWVLPDLHNDESDLDRLYGKAKFDD